MPIPGKSTDLLLVIQMDLHVIETVNLHLSFIQDFVTEDHKVFEYCPIVIISISTITKAMQGIMII